MLAQATENCKRNTKKISIHVPKSCRKDINMKAVCFGEIMLRLTPNLYDRFVQSEKFCASFGGGEANVSVSLQNYGLDASFVTKEASRP